MGLIAITKLKEKATQRTAPVDRPAIQSFMPLKCNSDENRGIKAERARNDKKDWMNSAQLWSSNQKPLLETETVMVLFHWFKIGTVSSFWVFKYSFSW